jgi:two-component system nitrate/nitrite response regulator NarP
LNILIVDNQTLLGQVLAKDLASEGHETEVVTAIDAALKKCAAHKYDVTLLEPNMPDVSGLHTIEQLCQKANNTKVLLFSAEVSVDFVEKAMNLGAWGYIPKNINANSLPSILDLVESGQKFLPSELLNGNDSDKSDFTERDVMVLKAIADGETNKDIARLIGTSEGNVKAIVRSICIQLGAKNRAHAVKLALDHSAI